MAHFFVAQAILDHEPEKRGEGLLLLEQTADTPPRPDTVLEDGRYAQKAREELQQLRDVSGSP